MWNEPEPEEVDTVCVELGGYTAVSRMMRKTPATVKRWSTSGVVGSIDYANWQLLKLLHLSRGVK